MADQSQRWQHESTGRTVALTRWSAALSTMVLALPGSAQEPVQAPVVLDPVVITATRKSERSFDVPAAIDRIGAETIQNGQPMVNLSEALARVPGIVTLNRQNYAQDLQVSSRGFGARAARTTRIADRPLTVTVGADFDRQREHRQGFVNVNGAVGDIRRDEIDFVASTDAYAQVECSPHDALSLTTGIRYSDVRFRSDDHYVTSLNADDSGRRNFGHASPVVGAVWHLTPEINAYTSYGEGFETPTFSEMAYRSGGSGLNFALSAGTSRAAEAGAKIIVARRHRINLAAFAIRTGDEIVIDTSTGGRTTFKNAGATRRNGFEAMWDGKWPLGFTSHLAYTYLRATFANEFRTGTPAVTVPAGARLPGVPATSAHGELAWMPGGVGGLQAAIEMSLVDKIFINDRNSDAVPRYAVASARIGLEQQIASVTLREFVRINNLSDRKYAGSVIVGDTNGRSFESAPGRNWSAGITAVAKF